MTIITATTTRTPLQAVAHDLYRDIHKGIRSELFAVTEEAGRLDPASDAARAALAGHVRSVVHLLVTHAEHEDFGVQPALEEHLPSLAERVATDHHVLDARIAELQEMADATADPTGEVRRWDVQRLYVELASFTSAYLEHQDVEERVIMPALEATVGPEAVLEIHGAIIGSIPPDTLARSLAVMLPAMNVDDRAELLGGMQQDAPPEAFQGVWSLAGSVLDAPDHAALAARLGIR